MILIRKVVSIMNEEKKDFNNEGTDSEKAKDNEIRNNSPSIQENSKEEVSSVEESDENGYANHQVEESEFKVESEKENSTSSDRSSSPLPELPNLEINQESEKANPTELESDKSQLIDKEDDVSKQNEKTLIDKLYDLLTKSKIVVIVLLCGTILAVIMAICYANLNNQLNAAIEERNELQSKFEYRSKRYDEVKKELDKVSEELNELKYGKDKILSNIKLAYEKKDWNSVISSANELHEKYLDTDQDKEGQKLKAEAEAKIKEAEEAEKKRKEEEERKKAEEEAKGYETGITYEQLARSPDDYLLQKVKFSGKVLQVMYDDDDDSVQIRLAVNSDYDQVLLCLIDNSSLKTRLLEDDIITIYGYSGGDISYEAVLGNEITIPMVFVDKVDQ